MADDWAQTIGSEPGERIRRPYPPGGPPGGRSYSMTATVST